MDDTYERKSFSPEPRKYRRVFQNYKEIVDANLKKEEEEQGIPMHDNVPLYAHFGVEKFIELPFGGYAPVLSDDPVAGKRKR